jgi:hypothetical protein
MPSPAALLCATGVVGLAGLATSLGPVIVFPDDGFMWGVVAVHCVPFFALAAAAHRRRATGRVLTTACALVLAFVLATMVTAGVYFYAHRDSDMIGVVYFLFTPLALVPTACIATMCVFAAPKHRDSSDNDTER